MIAAYVAGMLSSVTAEDAERLDLINIAFGTVKNGLLHFPRNEKAEIERLKAVNPSLKVLLSIGGWGAGGFSTMCATPEGIRAFTESCIECAERNALDGLDLDWEYPTIDSAGIDASPDDRQNFTALLASLRQALDDAYPEEHKMLTIAAGAGEYYIDAVEIERITPLLDYISLMTYDMAGAWTPAFHHTALYSSVNNKNSVAKTVKTFHEAGVPYDKLVIGAAFYSRRWTNIPEGGTGGIGQRCDDPNDQESGFWGPGFGGISALIDENGNGKDGWIVGCDSCAHARWLYHPEKRELLSYDDEASVREKIGYVKANSLRGIMYWEHNSDPTRRLLAAMAEADGKA